MRRAVRAPFPFLPIGPCTANMAGELSTLYTLAKYLQHPHVHAPITQATLIQSNSQESHGHDAKDIFSGLMHDCESTELHRGVYGQYTIRQ